MCYKIIENFSVNNSIKKYSNLKRMTMIFENKLKMRKLEVYLLMKYYKLSNSNNARTSNMSKSKPKPKNYDFNDVQISSIERKEMDDLKECTFVPKTISKSIRNLIKHKSNPSFITL